MSDKYIQSHRTTQKTMQTHIRIMHTHEHIRTSFMASSNPGGHSCMRVSISGMFLYTHVHQIINNNENFHHLCQVRPKSINHDYE